jgi:hypothetical protein
MKTEVEKLTIQIYELSKKNWSDAKFSGRYEIGKKNSNSNSNINYPIYIILLF